MGNPGKKVDIQNLLALGDDLLGVLKNKKDANGLMQSLEGVKLLHSTCQSDANEIKESLNDYQKKIHSCLEKIDKTRNETDIDAELEHLQHELDEKLQEEHLLQQELRAIRDELVDLEQKRISIEERREMIKQSEKDIIRARDLLSMCASVTNVIPNFEDETKISGLVVDKNKKKATRFEFEMTESTVDVCNKLWKMA